MWGAEWAHRPGSYTNGRLSGPQPSAVVLMDGNWVTTSKVGCRSLVASPSPFLMKPTLPLCGRAQWGSRRLPSSAGARGRSVPPSCLIHPTPANPLLASMPPQQEDSGQRSARRRLRGNWHTVERGGGGLAPHLERGPVVWNTPYHRGPEAV